MRHPEQTVNGGPANVVVDEFGSGRHGFTNGDPVLFNATLGVNGNATDVGARWFEDTTLNVKNACIEGNGVLGPTGNDANDDPFELTKAVNSAADVLTGSASFVSSGLRFTTSGVSLSVTLDPGVICYEGRKYHVSADQLQDADFSGATGDADEFLLAASRDSYISIAPKLDTDPTIVGAGGTMRARFTITVTDVANGDPAPAVPSGFFFAMLATDGSGVTSATVMNRGPVIEGDTGSAVRLRSPSGAGNEAYFEPTTTTVDLGALSSGDTDASLGHLFRHAYVQNVTVRGHNSGFPNDGVWISSRRILTVGGANNTMTVIDLDDVETNSIIEIEATVEGWSNDDNGYVRTIRQACRKTSGGTMGLYGLLRDTGGGAVDPGAIAGSPAVFIDTAEGDNSLIQIRVTGTVGRNIEWASYFRVFQKRGAF